MDKRKNVPDRKSNAKQCQAIGFAMSSRYAVKLGDGQTWLFASVRQHIRIFLTSGYVCQPSVGRSTVMEPKMLSHRKRRMSSAGSAATSRNVADVLGCNRYLELSVLFVMICTVASFSSRPTHRASFVRGWRLDRFHDRSICQGIVQFSPSRSIVHRSAARNSAGHDAPEARADEDEWKALVAAFQMYKAAYGDLKVPSRFIVPSMLPWPSKYYVRSLEKVVTSNQHLKKMRGE